MPSPDDIFYVIGFTRGDIAVGALRNLISLSLKSLEQMTKLQLRLHCFQLAVHYSQLVSSLLRIAKGDTKNAEGNEIGNDGRDKATSLVRIVSFFVFPIFFAYGWWRVRFNSNSERRWWIGLCSAVIGPILSRYGFNGFLDWSLQF